MSTDLHWWVKANWGHDLNPDQLRCMETICTIRAAHNLPLARLGLDRKPAIEVHPLYIAVTLFSVDLATFDGSELTRLVRAAHANRVRVGIHPALLMCKMRNDSTITFEVGPGDDLDRWVARDWWPQAALRVQANHRKPEGHQFERHPGPEALA